MCGIVGILAFTANAPILSGDLITQMRDTMQHRGPDDGGLYCDDRVALGQRRLSIIDLAGGMQPMSDAVGQLWVLNNGEIYNYQDLRRELESNGAHFQTESDTEAVIAGYAAYGLDIFTRLRGMFAAAIWDQTERRLILARDRVGKKPLYYAHLPEGLFFASEIKALLAYPNLPRDLDYDALGEYFTYQSIPDPLTIFKSIRKLPPGHYLTCTTEGALDIQPYWRWSLAEGQTTQLSYPEAVEQVRDILEESTRYRLISDVPLGALLSGGVDSSAIVAMMSRNSSTPVKTFSIGFSNSSYDERAYAREMAAYCGTDHHELLVETEHIRAILPRLAAQYDEPFADISALPTYYVCKMAREHVTVVLSGDGGDEAFAGYERYSKYLGLAPFATRPAIRALAGIGTAALPLGTLGRRTLRLLAVPPEMGYQRMNSLFEAPHLRHLLGRDTAPRHLITECLMNHPDLPLISRLQLADLEVYLTSTVLVKVDRASMLNSLEVRSPLLDHELLDFVGTLPPDWRMNKRILKDALRGLIPDNILTRPKAGFGIPLESWFGGDFGDFLREILLDEQTRRRGLLNVDYMARLLGRQGRPWGELTGQLWALLMFELWCRAYDISA